MIKNVIFDLDGTLLDTSRGILESVDHTISEMGLKPISMDEALSFIGPPLRCSFTGICGCTEEEVQRATEIFRSHYQNGAVLHAQEYEGIGWLCERLDERGIRMGVATNKPQRFAEALLKEYGLIGFFDSVCGADESGRLSKADLIRRCMAGMGASREETVLVGDTDNDVVGAESAGVKFIAVTYGFGFKKASDLENIKYIGSADTPSKVFEIIMDKEIT